MYLHFSVWGDDLIERELLRFAGRALDARPAWVAIHEDMQDELRHQFDTEGAWASGGWEPLADSTVRYKAANSLDPRILHATQDLRLSLTEYTDDTLLRITPDSLTFGSDLDYGEHHATGTVNMPQRRPIEFREMAKRGFVKTLQRYVVEGEVGVSGIL